MFALLLQSNASSDPLKRPMVIRGLTSKDVARHGTNGVLPVFAGLTPGRCWLCLRMKPELASSGSGVRSRRLRFGRDVVVIPRGGELNQ
jgi:hypothetical protein